MHVRRTTTITAAALAFAAFAPPAMRAAQILPAASRGGGDQRTAPSAPERVQDRRAPVAVAPTGDGRVEFQLVLPDGRSAAHASVRSARFRTRADFDFAWIAASAEAFPRVERDWTELVADEHGRIRVAPAAGQGWIEARWSDGGHDHVGASWVHDNLAHPGPHTLSLIVKHGLTVRILDADGTSLSGEALELLGIFGEVQDVRRSDASGRVRWDWTDIAAAHTPQVWPNDSTAATAAAVRATVVTADRDSHTLPLGHGEQEIRLPPSGWVTVTANVAGGLEADVELSVSGAGRRVPDVDGVRTRTRGGSARFRVGLGLEFEVEIGGVRVTFAGPTRAGEEVEKRWPMLVERPALRLLLVDETGRPRAHEPVRISPSIQREVEDRFGRRAIASSPGAITDANGMLVFELPREWPSTLVLRGRRAERVHGAPIEWEVRIDLSATRPGRPLDLGAIVTHELDVLAHGRVVDPSGRPLAGAEVRARANAHRPDPNDAPPFDGVTSGENGAFVLFGRNEHAAEWLHVSALGRNATAVRRSSPGPLRLVAGPKTYLALELAVPVGLADGALALVAVGADGREHPHFVPDERRGTQVRSIGMHYAPSGAVRLVLRCRMTGRDLAERSVDILADVATNADRWDVTTAIEWFELRVIGPDGELIRWDASVERDGVRAGETAHGIDVARLPRLRAGDVLVVGAEGHRTVRVAVANAAGDVRVELDRR